MSNEKNNWEVQYPVISFLERALSTHSKVVNVKRTKEILFKVVRSKDMHARNPLNILCLDEYAFSLAMLFEVLEKFPECNCISVGGNWNGYSPDAKAECLKRKIGLFVTSELLGALWYEKFWEYCRKDHKGNPIYSYRTA